jgi:hypothetical protein
MPLKNYYRLKLPFDNPLRPGFVFPSIENIKPPWQTLIVPSIGTFSKELYNWFKSIKAIPGQPHIFCGFPYEQCIIHTDGIDRPESAAINWVYSLDNSKSEMIWYNALEEGNIEVIEKTNREHIYWNNSQVKEIERYSIQSPALVRTDVPHSVINNADTHRWCVSVRFRPLKPWKCIVEMLQDYIISED